jgi:hypothetical protein
MLALSLKNLRHKSGLLEAALVIGFAFFYNLFFFNKYLPFTEGWFSLYADLMLRGYMPYKDFYLLLTPLYPKFIEYFSYFFGPEFIKLRIFGIFLFSFIALITFQISKTFTSPWKSYFITTGALVILESGNAFINYDYIYLYILLNLIGLYLLLLAKSKSESPAIFAIFIAGSGFFGALSFLTKQSNGSFFAFFLFLACIFSYGKNLKSILSVSFFYAFGSLVPLVITFVWLYLNDALMPAIDQVLFQASSSKGSLLVAISRWGYEFINGSFLNTLHNIFIVFCFFWIIPSLQSFNPKFSKKISCVVIAPLVILEFASAIPALSNYLSQIELIKFAALFSGEGHYFLVSTLLISTFIAKNLDRRLFGALILSSFGAIWGSGTSAGLTQISLYLAFIAVFIFLFNFNFITAIFSLILLVSAVFYYPHYKYTHPFSWWGYTLPSIEESDTKLEMGYGKGIYTSAKLASSYNKIYSIMKSSDQANQYSLVFPHMPIFQLNSNTIPYGKAVVYWFDFISNQLMSDETDLLDTKRPSFILLIDVPTETWEGHRRLFRAGSSMSHDNFLNKTRSIVAQDYLPAESNIQLGGEYQGTLYKLKNSAIKKY